MNKKYIIIIFVIIILIIVSCFSFYYLNRTETTYTDNKKIIKFFNDNRSLFDEIKDQFISLSGTIAQDGYVITLNEENKSEKKMYPYLAEKALEYYDAVVFPDPSIGSDGKGNVIFSFYYSTNKIKVGFLFTESEVSEDNYIKIDDNWYYYYYAMI